MTRKSRLMLTSLALLVVGAVNARFAAAADDPPANPPARQPGRGFMGGGAGMLGFIINAEAVQKDLALTDDQKESVKKAVEDFRTSARGLSAEERQSKLPELAKGLEGKVVGVLNDKQKERLKEIRLQVRGVSAVADKEVAEALKLTDDQVNKIKDLSETQQKDIREAFQSAGQGNFAEARDKVTKIRKEANDKILAVLNSDQKASFEKMQGAKIDLPATGFGFGPPRP